MEDCQRLDHTIAIEQAVGKPVVLDRPVFGKFMFVLSWDSSKPDSLRNALAQQGLVLTPQIEAVPTLIVEALETIRKQQ